MKKTKPTPLKFRLEHLRPLAPPELARVNGGDRDMTISTAACHTKSSDCSRD
jgi:hypothetical protein